MELHKFTTALRYRISIMTLRRLRLQADKLRSDPVLVIEFSGHLYFPAEKWALIPYAEFLRLKEKGKQNGSIRKSD